MEYHQLISNTKIEIYSIEQIQIGPWWNFKGVNSPFTRIYYAQGGANTWVQFKGNRYDLSEGTLLASPPYTNVDYFCGDHCFLSGIILTAEIFSGIQLFTLENLLMKVEADPLIPTLIRRLLDINPGKEVRIANPFHESYNEDIRRLPDRDINLSRAFESDSIVRMLISRFLTTDTPLFSSPGSTINTRMLKILDHIENNLHQPLPLETLANLVNLNPTYLSNTFTDCLKVRPTTYIKQKRVERAQRLLITTNHPLKQISYDVGIENTDYFFRVFKKMVGCTPSEYRKRYSAPEVEKSSK